MELSGGSNTPMAWSEGMQVDAWNVGGFGVWKWQGVLVIAHGRCMCEEEGQTKGVGMVWGVVARHDGKGM